MEEKASVVVAPPAKTSSAAFVIDGPGEYEVAGFVIEALELRAVGSFGTAVKASAEGMHCVWLPALASRQLADKEIEALGEVDILLLPLEEEKGGKYVAADPESAVNLMNAIEPRITIPLARAPGALLAFKKETGSEKIVPLDKFAIKAKELPEEPTIVYLQP